MLPSPRFLLLLPAPAGVRWPGGLFHPVSEALVALALRDDGDPPAKRLDTVGQVSSQPLGTRFGNVEMTISS